VDYKDAGVDIDAGSRAVNLMKQTVRSTFTSGVLTDIGGFGGLFALDKTAYREPVLVSATDGVGTKLVLAQKAGRHNTVGIDLVAMCANDVVTSGAAPLFFLDYIACGKLVPERIAEIVEGIAEGCRRAGAALLGGETAEHPGVMEPDDYDLAGFCVGAVEKDAIIDASGVEAGDVLLGLGSSGLHSNGFSLVRKILADAGVDDLSARMGEVQCSWNDELLRPTKIYAKSLLALAGKVRVKALAHITGGGITENVARVLPRGLQARIAKETWPAEPVFDLLAGMGGVDDAEMYRTFNMGIGMVAVVSADEVETASRVLSESGEEAYEIGVIVADDDGGVVIE
jgi:phosphoribosylformylglycinamidine cyclo-ligase